MNNAPSPSCRIWLRGSWRLATGQTITRTVSRIIACQPDDEETLLVAFDDLTEELRVAGYAFREGQGKLVEVLGTAHG
jgi:hypothetical protein